jgi:hypothetical protein
MLYGDPPLHCEYIINVSNINRNIVYMYIYIYCLSNMLNITVNGKMQMFL